MDLCVNLSLAKSDDPTYSAGPIFWGKDSGDYFYFLVTGDGWFSIKHWVNSRALEPVTWRQSDAIKKGVGQINQLHVMIRGDQAKAYINDTEVVTFKGQPPQGGGFIGLIGFSPSKATNKNVWEFSDLKVTK
jgi:hypothetical protein